MEVSEAPPIEWTTDEILTMLGINTQGSRNCTQEDMLMELKGIRHFNDEDAEVIQAACGGYSNRTLVNGIFLVTIVQHKWLISLMYCAKYQRWPGETTNVHHVRWSKNPTNNNHAKKNKIEKEKRWSPMIFRSNLSQSSNNWSPKLQSKAIMANPQEGEMDREQAPHLVDNLRSPKNDSFGVHYCVG